MKMSVGAVILAAGEGKRLKLSAPKPLAPCLDKKLVDYPLLQLNEFFKRQNLDFQTTVVVGHRRDEVRQYLERSHQDLKFAIQREQLGTADALKSYFEADVKNTDYDFTIVACADTPLITSSELETMFAYLINNNLDAVAATFTEENPYGYGRILRGACGFSIVEEKDASEVERKICEVNSGLYIFRTRYVLDHLKKVSSQNHSREFYLTDVFKIGLNVAPLHFEEKKTFLGVNNLAQLEEVEASLRERIRQYHRENGVRFIDAKTTYIDIDVKIGREAIIFPNVYLSGKTVIGTRSIIEAGAIIIDSEVHEDVVVHAYSHLEDVVIYSRASVGPFARLRPGTSVGAESKIGNFVEMKKAILEKGVKISHLSYVGDAFIGEETNIGCGFITCNYDGASKQITRIGKNCFIGSDSQTVAPVSIGDDCFVASSSTITKSMPTGAFAISRGQQVTKENLAYRFIKKKI